MRKCLTCGEEKEDNLFVSSKKCKACKRIVDKKWEQDNFDKIKERKKLKRLENPDPYKNQYKEYYQNNKDKVLSMIKNKRKVDKSHLETGKKYYQNNKEIILQKHLEYRVKKRAELGLPKAKVFKKNRFYIIEAGEFLGVGITHDKSRRMYEHRRELSLIGLHFKPLLFFDCENDKLIRRIETIVKSNFCDINLKIPGFKKETCNKKFFQEIYNIAINLFESEKENYKIIKHE